MSIQKNLEFCLKFDPQNNELIEKEKFINSKLKIITNYSSYFREELKTNIFLRCGDKSVKKALNLIDASEQEIFTRLRGLKDNF